MAKVLRYAGIAEESTYNPEIPPAAVIHIDIGSSSLDAPADVDMFYEGGLGRAARIRRRGLYSPSGNIVYAADVESMTYFFKWALGEYVFTLAKTLHECYGGNDRLIPSFTARIGKDVYEHVFAGCVINSLELAIDEWSEMTIDIMAARDTKDTLQEISALLLPTSHPLAYHDFTMNVGGDISAVVKSLNLSINNNLSINKGLNSIHPQRIVAGERLVSMDADLFFEDASHLEAFWGSATGPEKVGGNTVAATLVGTTDDNETITILLPKAAYTQVQIQPSGRDELIQSINFKGMVDTATLDSGDTVDTDILVSIVNSVGSL